METGFQAKQGVGVPIIGGTKG